MHGHARHVLLALATALLAPRADAQSRAPAPTDTIALQHLLLAEDARGTGRDGIEPLLAALDGPDSLLRRLAIRGLGRFQRPALGKRLLPALSDRLPSVRAEAANAVAQSVRRIKRSETAIDSSGFGTLDAARALSGALAGEADPNVADALAQSLGRLPLPDSAAARVAEEAIRRRFERQATPGVVHGLYTIARARKLTGTITPPTVALLRRTAVSAGDTVVRRLALLTLAAAGGLDSATAVRTVRDRDDETRRMTFRGAGPLSAPLRARLVRRALTDPSPIVRIEAIAAARLGATPPDCTPILAATRDRELYVSLTAIDSLASGCADRAAAIARLRSLAGRPLSHGPVDHRWQTGAHALLALARLDSAVAAASDSTVAGWLRGQETVAAIDQALMVGAEQAEVRVYAARAAAALGARTVLYRLAGDRDHNVQEAAIVGLTAVAGHEADSVYLRGLRSPGHQVSLAAATALQGTSDTSALPALLDALDDLSQARSENARDPRVAMLQRIGELGSRATAPRLRPYLADYDTAVAVLASASIVRWTGDSARPQASPLPIREEPLARLLLAAPARIRVTMAAGSGGGSFTVLLFPDETPATVARVTRLVREGFYNGKQFQRVEPNFVIQGGGPDANEYVGDTAFMRDELLRRTHARGTLGISARGRDTGDGQWFINLVDNPLLDHEFTIFGRIDGGQAVAERILEGDRVERMEVLDGAGR
jgi:cyclophilin family peptidyl-prolyl cis-trans isomerase/HEAT repeat protein